jgi:hypothetical protein
MVSLGETATKYAVPAKAGHAVTHSISLNTKAG